MNVNLANKLKELRKTKKISQEKLAQYLGVSYQAVSKWENGVTSPDIFLLPDIARYYGITVDELLQVEQINADRYFDEVSSKSEKLFRDGKRSEIISIWRQAYQNLPNDIRVKEMLMSIYFDTDKVKYQNEIIELGTEIYNANAREGGNGYYQGTAIYQIACTYYANGNREKANEWSQKAHQINHCQEMLYTQIHDEEDYLTDTFIFANYWYLQVLFYMTARLNVCNIKCFGEDYLQNVNIVVANLFEMAYPNDDMSYEALGQLCTLHRCIAEDEIHLRNDEAVVRKHLSRAVECALKSLTVSAHKLIHPLLYGWNVADAPADNMQLVRNLTDELMWECFSEYQSKDWFISLISQLESIQ